MNIINTCHYFWHQLLYGVALEARIKLSGKYNQSIHKLTIIVKFDKNNQN